MIIIPRLVSFGGPVSKLPKNKVDICGGSLVELKNGNLITDFPSPKTNIASRKLASLIILTSEFDYGYHRFIYRTDF